jgi:hypothetical protein
VFDQDRTVADRGWRDFLSSTGVVVNNVTRIVAVVAMTSLATFDIGAQAPTAVLTPASTVRLSGRVDSNSPAVWETVDGEPRLFVMTSIDGSPMLWSGSRLARMNNSDQVLIHPHPGYGVWMEAIVVDEAGIWYGYYHHEVPADVCGRPDRMLPRLGPVQARLRLGV